MPRSTLKTQLTVTTMSTRLTACLNAGIVTLGSVGLPPLRSTYIQGACPVLHKQTQQASVSVTRREALGHQEALQALQTLQGRQGPGPKCTFMLSLSFRSEEALNASLKPSGVRPRPERGQQSQLCKELADHYLSYTDWKPRPKWGRGARGRTRQRRRRQLRRMPRCRPLRSVL